jgi:hypothetical protein
LVQLGRQGLLHGRSDLLRLVVLLLRLVLLSKLREVLELWRSKRRRRAWLKWATQQQL